jgi:uncharacterized cupin superfamily protein
MDRRSSGEKAQVARAVACSGLVVFSLLAAGPTGASEAGAEAGKGAPAPVRLDPDKLGGLGLVEYEPFPPEAVLEGRSKHRSHVFFSGPEIVVEVYEAEPAKLAISDPFPYDEFVYVLSGKLILTDARGKAREYSTGEFLVVPKGFTGTWEMLGNYRELIVIEKKAYQRAEGTE